MNPRLYRILVPVPRTPRPKASGLKHHGKVRPAPKERSTALSVQWKHPPFRGNQGAEAWKPGGPPSKASIFSVSPVSASIQ